MKKEERREQDAQLYTVPWCTAPRSPFLPLSLLPDVGRCSQWKEKQGKEKRLREIQGSERGEERQTIKEIGAGHSQAYEMASPRDRKRSHAHHDCRSEFSRTPGRVCVRDSED